MKTAKEKMRKYVENLSDGALVAAFNEYCKADKCCESMLFPNDDWGLRYLLPDDPVDCFHEGMVTHCQEGYFPSDDYVYLDEENHITSCNASNIDLDALVDWLLELLPRHLTMILSCTYFQAMDLLKDDEEEKSE